MSAFILNVFYFEKKLLSIWNGTDSVLFFNVVNEFST